MALAAGVIIAAIVVAYITQHYRELIQKLGWVGLRNVVIPIAKEIGRVYAKQSKSSDKNKKNDIPSFAAGGEQRAGESLDAATKRILRENGRPIKKGPNTEYSKIRKWLSQKGQRK